MWTAEMCHPDEAPDWLAISMTMDTLTLDVARAFCDAIYELIKTRVVNKDMRDIHRLVDLMTDLHQIIQEESRRTK